MCFRKFHRGQLQITVPVFYELAFILFVMWVLDVSRRPYPDIIALIYIKDTAIFLILKIISFVLIVDAVVIANSLSFLDNIM